jgi:LuxR family maltose regulon positive regulatory protein
MYSWYSWIALADDEPDIAKKSLEKSKQCFDRNKRALSQKEQDIIEVGLLLNALSIDIYEANFVKIYLHIDKLRKYKLEEPANIDELNRFESRLLNTRLGFMGRLKHVNIYKFITDEIYDYMGDTSATILTILAEALYEQNMLDQAYNLLIKRLHSDAERPGAFIPASILNARIKMASGDLEGAFSAIENARRLTGEKSGRIWGYHLGTFQAMLHFQAGEFDLANALNKSDKLSIYDAPSCIGESQHILFARLLVQENRLDDALLLLKRLEQFARSKDRLMSLMEILCLTAICQSKKVDFQSAMQTLKEALELGSKEGYIRVFVDEREPMAVLLDRYISQNRNGGAGVHLTYARNLLKLTNDYIAVVNARQQNQEGVKTAPDLLTKTELEIMKYMMQQASNQQIADDLFLSINTVKKYNARIFDKLGVNNRYEAMQKAKQLGLSD